MNAASTARVLRWRARHRAGRVVVQIEIDETAVGELLAHYGLLSACGCDDSATLGWPARWLIGGM